MTALFNILPHARVLLYLSCSLHGACLLQESLFCV